MNRHRLFLLLCASFFPLKVLSDVLVSVSVLVLWHPFRGQRADVDHAFDLDVDIRPLSLGGYSAVIKPMVVFFKDLDLLLDQLLGGLPALTRLRLNTVKHRLLVKVLIRLTEQQTPIVASFHLLV